MILSLEIDHKTKLKETKIKESGSLKKEKEFFNLGKCRTVNVSNATILHSIVQVYYSYI